MKTAISWPGDTFDRAERAAQQLGGRPSEPYARAVRQFAVSQLGTSDRPALGELAGTVPIDVKREVDAGLARVPGTAIIR